MNRTIILNNGVTMPLLGLGVYRLQEKAEETLKLALKMGYRLVDTAPVYKNEEAIGRGIAASGVARSDLFLTSKIWNNAQRLGDSCGALGRSLDRLGVSYVDLCLIHWPVPGCYLATWKELERLMKQGKVRSIGVSNFSIEHLEELKKISPIRPAVNQVEVHPLCYPKKLIEYCNREGIRVQAYAPLARGAYLDNDFLCVLATKYAKTPAQIGLRYLIQRGISVIPKASTRAHLTADADLWSFSISQEDMEILDSLNEDYHSAEIPEDLRDSVFY